MGFGGCPGLGSAVGSSSAIAVVARAYVRGARDLGSHMHFFSNARGDGYAWLFPLPGGAANVGLGFVRGEPGASELPAAFARFLGPQSPATAFLLRAEAAPVAIWPIPLGPPRRAVAAPDVFLAGDG